MVVRPVEDDDSDEQDTQNEQQEQQEETSKIEMVGYQVDSSTLALDDLIRGQRPSPTRSNTTSVSSETLLALPQLTPYTGPLPFPDFASAPLAFAFLSNGARAWKAFVRAYPMATVGTPTTWEWNINKAVFEMKVSVGAEDAAYVTHPVDAENEDEDEAQTAAIPEAAPTTFIEQSVPTEIFIPLLHFAKNDVVRKAFGIPTSTASNSANGPQTGPLNSEPTAQQSSVPLLDDNSMVSLSVDPSKLSLNALEMSSEIGASTSRLGGANASRVETEFSMETALDLEVSVNGGRWELEGQVLKWWYPVPAHSPKSAASSSQAQLPRSKSTASIKAATKTPTIGKDGKVEYTITIKRKGGAIDFKKLGIPESWVGLGPKGDEEKAKSRRKKAAKRKAECCGTGCVIV